MRLYSNMEIGWNGTEIQWGVMALKCNGESDKEKRTVASQVMEIEQSETYPCSNILTELDMKRKRNQILTSGVFRVSR